MEHRKRMMFSLMRKLTLNVRSVSVGSRITLLSDSARSEAGMCEADQTLGNRKSSAEAGAQQGELITGQIDSRWFSSQDD